MRRVVVQSDMLSRIVLLCPLAVTVWAQSAATKQVEIYGQKIYYQEAGSGPDVILLHGLGADRGAWAATVPALAAKFHVYVPDQVGFGQSDKPALDYRVGTLVDFLDAFYKKVGVTKATLVGNSLGGWVAMDFALAHPDKVTRLVLVDSAGYSPQRIGGSPLTREALQALNPSTVAGEKRLMALVFYNKMFASDQFAEQAFTTHLRKNDGYTIDRFIDSILRGEDVVDGKLGAIKAPTLVVWGREDMLVPLAAGKALAEDIPGAQSVILDSCGHVPPVECAAPFNAALLKYLE
ncbi:MAG TPA: alpha/beta hydrolase [Bryobacteraceae bacterium]|nr:alpha/beta hydrolase [Bryobacteraceae bacterium]